MLITDDFVMLNFPKTGSTFARHVIKRLYLRRQSAIRRLLVRLGIGNGGVEELMLPKIDEASNAGFRDQHGTLRQVPAKHREKPILTISRNPFSRYISLYHFKWWQEHPPADRNALIRQFPGFPDLDFSEYYRMTHTYGIKDRLGGITPKIELGLHTIQFIQFYFFDPESVLRKIDDEYIDTGAFHKDMCSNISFIHQENLNVELKEFLTSIGFADHELQIIDSTEEINVTKKDPERDDSKRITVDEAVANQILARDKLVFKVFPEYLPPA